jgi:hypothetical protein
MSGISPSCGEEDAVGGRGKPAQYSPVRFVGKDARLLHAFDALALWRWQKCSEKK